MIRQTGVSRGEAGVVQAARAGYIFAQLRSSFDATPFVGGASRARNSSFDLRSSS